MPNTELTLYLIGGGGKSHITSNRLQRPKRVVSVI